MQEKLSCILSSLESGGRPKGGVLLRDQITPELACLKKL